MKPLARFNSTDIPARPAPWQARRFGLGLILTLAVFALIGGILIAINAAASNKAGPVSNLWPVLLSGTRQALITTILSLIIGVALAWALNRSRFAGRTLLAGLFGAAIVTPGLVVAIGLIGIWGRAGWIAQVTEALFGTPLTISIFGLWGIVLAHIILDATFVARICLARLDALPATRLKLGQSLGLSAFARFRLIDWPAISGALPGLGALVFLLAFTSFPVVLLLGGGPANQTLEVAIYTAVRFDFDLAAAAQLSLLQISICALVIVPATYLTPSPVSLTAVQTYFWPDTQKARWLARFILAVGTFVFIAPLASVLANGVQPSGLGLFARASFWASLWTSLSIGAASALLALVMGYVLAAASATPAGRRTAARGLLGIPAFAYLAVPAVSLSLGFFLIARNAGVAPATMAPFALVLANALLALPFAVATLRPAQIQIANRYDRLTRALNLSGPRRLLRIEWPLLAPEIGLVLALGFCFSLGDLGVISMFGTESFSTLPWLMNRALGAYRSNDAALIAALMLIIAIAAFIGLPRLTKRLANA